MRVKTPLRVVRALACFAVLLALASVRPVSLRAQWLRYPTAGVPRTSTGAPNLNAPAPRMADGKPDFSGVWDVEHNRPCPPDGCADMPVGHEFINIGWSLKGGLPYLPWAAALAKKRTEDLRVEDPDVVLPPDRDRAAAHDGVAQEDRADAGAARHSQRAQRHLPADLHRRTPAAGGSEPVLGRVFLGTLGRRHAGRAERGLSRRAVARRQRQSADRRGAADRAVPPGQLREAGNRRDGRTIRRRTAPRGP